MIERRETPAFGVTLPEKKSAFVISIQGRRSRLSLSIFICIIYVTIAASLQIGRNNKIIVGNADMVSLQASLKQKNRGGAYYSGLFKNAVPLGAQYPNLGNSAMACHHIIPNNVLENVAKGSTRVLVENYVNTAHIRAIIAAEINLNPNGRNDGMLIHASISWNPNNLVRGPDAQHRSDDPGPGYDVPILNRQSQAYQASVNRFRNQPSLGNFAMIPRPTPVTFQRDQPANPNSRYHA